MNFFYNNFKQVLSTVWAKGAIFSPGKRDFTIYFAMFEFVMYFEKFPTI